ncbi:MAG TPA: thioredoxin-like domain-containing protein [Bryobacteraceae bacterium]|nr:thioredoxin-like domain-containing protein [Bryobacteraceae bacterium]
MFRKYNRVSGALILAAVVAAAAPDAPLAQQVAENKMLEGRTTAPEFPDGLSWLNTRSPVKLRELRGKFVLLDFWTFCCINCMHIIPDLRKLEEKYDQELVVIGVHSAKFRNEKETGQIREAVIRYGIRHPVVNDSDFQIWNSYGARAWPTLVLINPAGKIMGTMSGEGIFEPIDEVLTQGIPYFSAKGLLVRSPMKNTLEAAARPETLLSYPGKISADQASGRLFITDSNHNRILIVNSEGRILDVIGSGEEGSQDGQFDDASFHHPQGTFLYNNVLYIADTENHLLRTADLMTRELRTVLGTGAQARRLNVPGTGREVALNSPWDVVVYDGKAYIAMAGSHQIWEADLKTWKAQPFAGSARENIADGGRLDAALAQTSGLARDGERLLFADSETSSVRAVTLQADGKVTTIVGKGLFDFGDRDGACESARFQHPLGVAMSGNLVYVADTYNSKIKVIDPAKCSAATLAGNGTKGLKNGKLSAASFNEPGGLAWLSGKLYVADTNNHVIRVVDPKANSVSTLELTGLEKLASHRPSRFRGRAVRLAPVAVQPGKTDLALSLVLPDGYKLNRGAPLYLSWSAPAVEHLQFTPQPEDVDLKNAKLPLHIKVTKLEKNTDIAIDAIVYYCTTEQSVCLVDRLRASLELQPSSSAPESVPVEVVVKRPGSL